jgi:hypothetical protein
MEMINEARALVQREQECGNPHFSCTYQVWDIFMAPDRAAWALDYISNSWENKVQPHIEACTRYTKLHNSNPLMGKMEAFITRFVAHRLELLANMEEVDQDGWFKFMCEGVEHVQKRIQRELGATGYCSDKAAWVGFMKWTQGMYWHSHKTMTVENKAKFSVKPSDEQREAISKMLWLESLAWEAETKAQDEHIDNWTGNFDFQKEECARTEFDSMWELNQAMRGEDK